MRSLRRLLRKLWTRPRLAPPTGKCYVPVSPACREDVHVHGGERFVRAFRAEATFAQALAAAPKIK